MDDKTKIGDRVIVFADFADNTYSLDDSRNVRLRGVNGDNYCVWVVMPEGLNYDDIKDGGVFVLEAIDGWPSWKIVME